MPRAMLVYNPRAGRFSSPLLVQRAALILRKAGWQVQVTASQSGEHITTLASQAAEQHLDVFLVAGGDGSLNHALPALAGTHTTLGVLPAGTANVWAQELGLPGLTWTRWFALEECARRLAAGYIKTIDLGYCNGLPFLLWSGVGLDAYVVDRLEPRSRFFKTFAGISYLTSAVWSASQWRGTDLQVQVDGRQFEGHYLLALVSNARLYGGGLASLSPETRPDDGRLDLWLFGGRHFGDTVQRMLELGSGRHLGSAQVSHLPVEALSMQVAGPIFVQVDGEPVEVKNPIKFHVQPQALRVLVGQARHTNPRGDRIP